MALHTPPAPRRAARTFGPSRRRGVASLIAMLYLVVFAALALGFYAQTNMAMQTSNNERRMKEALMGAETGLQFIRYQLSRLTLNPLLTDSQVFEDVQMQLAAKLNNTTNLAGGTVGDIDYSNNTFEIPSQADKYIKVNDAGPWFRCRLELQGRDIVVTTIGKSGNTLASSSGGRAGIEVRFRTKEWPSKVLDYGMASPNTVNVTVAKLLITGGAQSSILSTYTAGTPVTLGNVNSTAAQPTGIEGKITLMTGAPNPTYVGTNYSVGGLTTSAAINSVINQPGSRLTEAPEWPIPDTTLYSKFATTKYTGGTGTFDNIYLDAATTPTVTFDQNSTIRGVLYVKKGVKLSFSGGVNLQCVIVGEPAGTIATPNLISFSGNGVAKLSVADLPLDQHQFDGIRELAGTFIIAPRWEVQFAGSFVSAAGSVWADKISYSGNSPATIAGQLVNLGNYPLTITGSSGLALIPPPTTTHPGVRFTERFAPVKSSYKEVQVKG